MRHTRGLVTLSSSAVTAFIIECICVSPVRYGLPTVYLCVPYGSHSKQRLFPHTALTGWAL
jgi:hypothetical protein